MGLFGNLFGSREQPKFENSDSNENLVPTNINTFNSRDKIKNKEYFYNALRKVVDNRKKLAYVLRDKYLKENNFPAIKNFGNNISTDIYIYISYWFSMGKPIDYSWRKFYLYNLYFYTIAINKEILLNGLYIHSSKILSIGILLGIEKEEFKKISDRYVEEGYEDFILDCLVRSQYPAHPVSQELQFPDEAYIQKLAAILKAQSIQESEAIAKETLEKYFYTKENLQTSYDSHKTEFYSGYWAWEVAAIVKIMGLDDSAFKDNPYYPYDMVHWLDKKV